MTTTMRATVLAVLGTLLLGLFGFAPSGRSTTVATDACAAPLEETDAGVTPWTDLCALAIDADVDAAGVTTVEVRLEVASVERATPSMFTVRWDVDGCIVRLVSGDATPQQDAINALVTDCADEPPSGEDCVVDVTAPTGHHVSYCGATRGQVDIPAPTIEGTAYVWRIEVRGDVADVVGPHARGTELAVGTASAGPRVHERDSVVLGVVCGGSGPDEECTAVGGDWMPSGATVTVG